MKLFIFSLVLFSFVFTISNFTDIEICSAYRYGSNQKGFFGNQGEPSIEFLPSARNEMAFTKDEKRNLLWIYGGYGFYANSTSTCMKVKIKTKTI